MGLKPKVLFYVQHLLGIGHLVRASRIAQALVGDGFAVTIAMGGFPVPGFPAPGVGVEMLEPIKSADADFSTLVDGHGRTIDDALKERRRQSLLELFAREKPDILVVEAFPFGRRQMRFELLPLLDAAKAAGTPLIVSSVRDILQENRKPGREAEIVEMVRSSFDLVMVHGDPSFSRLEETFPAARDMPDRIAYTGLVAGEVALPGDESYEVVVSAGGGRAGERLIACASEVANMETGRWCIIAGAGYRPEASPARAGIVFHQFRPDFPNLLAGARISISQAGYNTVCDILRAGVRPVLVPFATGGETEQTHRALRLAAMGHAVVVQETDLTAEVLAEAIRTAPPSHGHGLDLEGARGTARLLRERLNVKRGR